MSKPETLHTPQSLRAKAAHLRHSATTYEKVAVEMERDDVKGLMVRNEASANTAIQVLLKHVAKVQTAWWDVVAAARTQSPQHDADGFIQQARQCRDSQQSSSVPRKKKKRKKR